MTHEAITKDALDIGLIAGLLLASGLALGYNWPGLLMCLLGVAGYSVAAYQVGEDRGIGRGAAAGHGRRQHDPHTGREQRTGLVYRPR